MESERRLGEGDIKIEVVKKNSGKKDGTKMKAKFWLCSFHGHSCCAVI